VGVSFAEATTLADEADVRVSGVSVGRVVELERDPAGNRTLAKLELKRQYAPLHKDARAILRQKTLLGETYVELTLGRATAGQIPEDGRLADSRVAPTVELDEVLELFPPETVADFRRWQANSAKAIRGRGQDFNAALGGIAGFADEGADLLTVLNRNADTLGDLVRNTGTVFEALTRDETQYRAFIADTSRWLQATASEREALAESFQIFPTFLRESRATLVRLERFSGDTKPLVDALGPVGRDLAPTLVDLRATAPDLQTFFGALPAVIAASEDGLPALSRVLTGLRPVLDATGAFLAQLNPVLQWLQLQQGTVSNFITMPGWALRRTSETQNPNSNGHVLPQLVVTGSQTLITPQRTEDNRGNAYFKPDALNFQTYRDGFNILPNWDCNNAPGGEHRPTNERDPGCIVQEVFTFKDQTAKQPRVLSSKFPTATR
jgi:phospholipid/cholesterol/gamma-HCH transport system substrate-binding protein